MLEKAIEPSVLLMEKSDGLPNHAGKVTDICWLAGITDGDGCIGIHKQPEYKHGKTTYVPKYSISTTCLKTYRHLDSLCKSLEIGHYWTYRKGSNPNWKDIWVLEVRGMKRVGKLLRIIGDFLVTKREESDLLLEFISRRLDCGPGHEYNDSELTIIARMKEIKRSRNGNL